MTQSQVELNWKRSETTLTIRIKMLERMWRREHSIAHDDAAFMLTIKHFTI